MGGGPPLHFSPLPDKGPAPRGHRRHASFDPNTDCFAHYNFLVGSGGGGGGGAEGGPGDSGRRWEQDAESIER